MALYDRGTWGDDSSNIRAFTVHFDAMVLVSSVNVEDADKEQMVQFPLVGMSTMNLWCNSHLCNARRD